MPAPAKQGQVFFNLQEFDEAIRSHGVILSHSQVVPCPVGMKDANDLRRPGPDHEGCENGWIIRPQGTIKALFYSNSLRDDWKDAGVYESSSVSITIPRYYEDNPQKIVRVLPYDRLYLNDSSIMVEHWCRVNWNLAGVDALKFPVEQVEFLIDSRGIEYHYGKDFELNRGRIKWLPTGNSPGVDPDTNLGRVYSIRFLYRPYYIVDQNFHELRLVTQRNQVTGASTTVMMPQAISIRRENIFRDADNDPQSLDPKPKRESLPPSNIRTGTPNMNNPLGGI